MSSNLTEDTNIFAIFYARNASLLLCPLVWPSSTGVWHLIGGSRVVVDGVRGEVELCVVSPTRNIKSRFRINGFPRFTYLNGLM